MEEEIEIIEPNYKKHLVPSLIAGYLSGIGHILVAHPADTIKVSLPSISD